MPKIRSNFWVTSHVFPKHNGLTEKVYISIGEPSDFIRTFRWAWPDLGNWITRLRWDNHQIRAWCPDNNSTSLVLNTLLWMLGLLPGLAGLQLLFLVRHPKISDPKIIQHCNFSGKPMALGYPYFSITSILGNLPALAIALCNLKSYSKTQAASAHMFFNLETSSHSDRNCRDLTSWEKTGSHIPSYSTMINKRRQTTHLLEGSQIPNLKKSD